MIALPLPAWQSAGRKNQEQAGTTSDTKAVALRLRPGPRRVLDPAATRFPHDSDHAVTFELGKGAADGFNGQAKEIRNFLTAHRQGNRL
jgi:hypothetical protein